MFTGRNNFNLVMIAYKGLFGIDVYRDSTSYNRPHSLTHEPPPPIYYFLNYIWMVVYFFLSLLHSL